MSYQWLMVLSYLLTLQKVRCLRLIIRKGFKQGLKPIVVIKIDKSDSRPDDGNEVFIYLSLLMQHQQLDFPVLYASGRSGWCVNDLSDDRSSLTPLLNKIISHVPSPDG